MCSGSYNEQAEGRQKWGSEGCLWVPGIEGRAGPTCMVGMAEGSR